MIKLHSHQSVTLSEDYYLRNFDLLADFVADHYWPLLSTRERRFYESYKHADADARRLYVRLLSRTRLTFRISKLHYPEITSIEAAARQLESLGLAAINPDLPLQDVLGLFTCAELKKALGSKAGKRSALLDTIQHDVPAIERLLASEHIIQILQLQHFTVFSLLYFGNLHQDLTTFVLRDLGLHRYESYLIDRDNLPFRSREQLDRHMQYYQCRQAYEQLRSANSDDYLQLLCELPAPTDDDPVLHRLVERLTSKIARQLERLQQPDCALAIYRTLTLPPARERSARILAKQDQNSDALAICRSILKTPLSAEELQFAQQFGNRLAKRTSANRDFQLFRPPPPRELRLPRSNHPVERTVALHYQSVGRCFYVENTLFCSMLGLAIWDIIFMPIKGVFYHPFQMAPADFYTPDFAARRQQALSDRWHNIASGQLNTIVQQRFNNSYGKMNPLVNWRILDEDILALATARIPVSHWLTIFKHILADARNNRTGLPDLLHFPHGGGYELIEVKAPGDKMQKNQLSWLQVFCQNGIPHEVVNVCWHQAEATETPPVESVNA